MISLALAALATGGLTACGSRRDAPEDVAVDLVASDVERAAVDPASVPAAVEAMHAFGGRLYGRLAEREGNLALSPYSVAVALGMTLHGAGGTTADEISGLLAGLGAADLGAGLNALEQALEALAGRVRRYDGSDAEVALAVASALFGERTERWKDPFLDALARDFGAGMYAVDFKGSFEEARVGINDWVAGRTADRIEDLVPQGALDDLTRLVVVNALYLKAPWESPFVKQATAKADFHLADGSVVEVDMMQSDDLDDRVTRGDGWRSVRVPYAGGGLAMTVVLPDAGLAALERTIARDGIGAVLASDEDGPLANLRMPRWTFRTAAPLGDALKALGMPTAFDVDRADFSAMTDGEPLFLDAVLHQVFIAVDEEGTEAAAATAEVFSAGSAPPVLEEVVLDRPFLFVIHDTEHGAPLFVGRVADPRDT